MRKVLQVTDNNHQWELEDDSSRFEENEELLDVINLKRTKRSPLFYSPLCYSPPCYSTNISIPTLPDLGGPILIICLIGILSQLPPPTFSPPQIPDGCTPSGGVGCAPQGVQPQPGSPGGGAIPIGNTLIQAQNLLATLGLLGLPVAVFPPYADGSFVSPRTGFRTFAMIYTDDGNPR